MIKLWYSIIRVKNTCGCGGTGRRARFRFLCPRGVQVRFLSSAETLKTVGLTHCFLLSKYIIIILLSKISPVFSPFYFFITYNPLKVRAYFHPHFSISANASISASFSLFGFDLGSMNTAVFSILSIPRVLANFANAFSAPEPL